MFWQKRLTGARTWAADRVKQGVTQNSTSIPAGTYEGYDAQPEAYITDENGNQILNPDYRRWLNGEAPGEAEDSIRSQLRNSVMPYDNFGTELGRVLEGVRGVNVAQAEGQPQVHELESLR